MKDKIIVNFNVAFNKFKSGFDKLDMAITRKLLAYIAANERNLN